MSVSKLYKRVAFVADTNGNPVPRIAIQVNGEWHALDPAKLERGDCDELIRVATISRISMAVPHNERRALCDRILHAQSGVVIWLDGEGYQEVSSDGTTASAFVWRGKPHWVGEAPSQPFQVAQRADGSIPASRGSLAQWKAFSRSFAGNHYLVVGIGAALSALLVKPLRVDPLSMVLVGRSSIGKSAIQAAIMSLIRPPKLNSAGGTPLGLHQLLTDHQGQPVFIEDLRQQRDRDGLLDIFFDVGNGASRSVAGRWQAARSRAMDCTVIASNELLLSEMSRGKAFEAGIEARVAEIEIQEKHGAFHKLPAAMNGAQFAQHLKVQASKSYGVVWDEWIAFAASQLDDLRQAWDRRQDRLLASLMGGAKVPDGLNGRVLRGFAFWMFCALRARKAKLLGFSSASIRESFIFVAASYLDQRQSGLSKNDEALVAAVRSLIREHPNRFPEQTKEALEKGGAWGFRRQWNVNKQPVDVIVAYPKELVRRVAPLAGSRALVHALTSAKYLLPNKDRLVQGDRVVKLPDGTTARMFVIRASVLSE